MPCGSPQFAWGGPRDLALVSRQLAAHAEKLVRQLPDVTNTFCFLATQASRFGLTTTTAHAEKIVRKLQCHQNN